MNQYLNSLQAMHELLGALQSTHWRDWIAKDIAEWQNSKSTRHHLSAYGGMGSFNDLAFTDPWLDTLFGDLKSACNYFAHHPEDMPDISKLKSVMGETDFVLSGWRCFACGYCVVSHRDIERFIAHKVVREHILEEIDHGHLLEFVRSVIQSPPSDRILSYTNVAEWVAHAGINIREADGWFRPCSNCNSEHTGAYRWSLSDSQEFIPSKSNLNIRKSAP